MANYDIVISPRGYHFVHGLKQENPLGKDFNRTILLVRNEEDVIVVQRNDEHMHESLYDLYQVHNDLKDGDTFAINGVVVYRCEGVHVVKVD